MIIDLITCLIRVNPPVSVNREQLNSAYPNRNQNKYSMKKIILVPALIFMSVFIFAQTTPSAHILTMEEYEKAKTFSVKDLDNDTYVKFDNTYVLDRYEARKPYYITGDDGQKKRVDLYRFLLKDGMQELGMMIFYTTEKGKLYKACLPDFKAPSKIWEKYFEDIHAIDKVEPNFVLKLSYILSKELGFQLYKAANAGKDISKEAGTYGSDICFPGTVEVSMADGSKKILSDVKQGDKIITVDPATNKASITQVTELVAHEEKNYAITRLILLSANEINTKAGKEINLVCKELTATPTHPVITKTGEKKMGEVTEGDEILCADKQTGIYQKYTVWMKSEQAGGMQKVYNIVTNGGSTFIMNDVMVLQKPLKD